ncbi:MAG: PAS domain S-box protein [Deltaproteobacteria bacterium]|nr:PAS domain S-box protein [Deltaproteobacteria bacterium]
MYGSHQLEKRANAGRYLLDKTKPSGVMALIGVATIVFTSMTGYQLLKWLVFPNMTLLQSNLITNLVVTLVSTLTAYLWINQRRLLRRLVAEVKERELSEEHYRNIVEDQTEFICRFLPDGKLTFINQAICRYFFRQQDELAGTSLLSLIYKDDRECVANQINSLCRHGFLAKIECRMVLPHANVRCIRWNLRAIADLDGQIMEIQAVGQDITEKKLSDRLTQIQYELSLDLNSVTDTNEIFKSCLDAVLKIDGIDCAGIYLIDEAARSVRPLYQYGLPAKLNTDVCLIKTKLLDDSWSYEFDHDLKEELNILENINILAVIPVKYEDRNMAILVLLSHQIAKIEDLPQTCLETIVLRTQSALTRIGSQQRVAQRQLDLKKLFDSIDDLVFVLSDGGQIINCNPAVRSCLGYSIDELTGKYIFDFYSKEDRGKLDQILDETINTGASRHEIPILKKDGAWVSVDTRMSKGSWENRRAVFGISRDISDIKIAEEALRENIERFRQMFETNQAIKLVVNPHDGSILDANQAACNFYGYSRDELIGMKVSRINTLPPDQIKAEIEKAASGEQLYFQFQHRLSSGAIRDVEVYAGPITVQGKTLLYSIIHDITERKQIENALIESEEKFRQLSENIQDLFWLGAIDWTAIYYVSNAYEKIWGRPCSSVYEHPLSWLDGVVEEDRQEVENYFLTIKDGTDSPGKFPDCRIRSTDGSIRWVSARHYPVRDKSGKIYRISGIVEDITARKNIEMVLNRLVTQHNAILENVPVGIAFVKNRKFIWQNQKMEDIFGYSFAEMENQTTALYYVSKEEYKQFGDEAYPIISQGKTCHTERLMKRKDGSLFWCSLTGKGILLGDEQSGSIWISDDISLRKKAEEEIIKARQFAEITNRTKSEFLANMSHELRTPLNGIIGGASLLVDTDLNIQQYNYAVMVKTSAEALLDLINDILDLSKIEAGRMELEKVDFDLQEVLSQVFSIITPKAAGKEVRLDYLINDDVPQFLQGDPVRLRQVLINLVGNAIKFTQEGFVSAIINLEEIDGQQCRLRFRVIDTGIGLPPDKISDIFEPFKQVDGSITRRYGGTGLGLAISKKIVELMNGEIWAANNPALDRGATFNFTAWMDIGRKIIFDDDIISPISYQHPCRKVLLVEDNAINQMITRELLKKVGHIVDTANNGREAVEKYTEHEFDLVLMDVQMPVMDGFQATRLIRQKEEASGKHIPIIAMTAYAMKGDRERCLNSGMDDYITKPVSAEKLYVIVNRLVINEPVSPLSSGTTPEPDIEESTPPNSLFDQHDLLQRVLDDIDLAKEIAKGFLDQASSYLEDIVLAISESNSDKLLNAAHLLKGAAGNISATAVSNIAFKLEQMAREGNLDSAQEAYVALERAVELVRPVLMQFCDA